MDNVSKQRNMLSGADLFWIALSRKTDFQFIDYEDGIYVIRMRSDREGAPHGELYVWLIYSQSCNAVMKTIDSVKSFLQAHRMILVDDYDPIKHYHLGVDVAIFSDSGAKGNAVEVTGAGGVKGTVGWICGQGYNLDSDEEGLSVILCKLMGNFLGDIDPFTTIGRYEMNETAKMMEEKGIQVETIGR